jgi:hypothetical protein
MAPCCLPVKSVPSVASMGGGIWPSAAYDMIAGKDGPVSSRDYKFEREASGSATDAAPLLRWMTNPRAAQDVDGLLRPAIPRYQDI